MNHKVYLFGSYELHNIPQVITDHIRAINEQTGGDVEFILGDGKGVDQGYQAEISTLGLDKKTQVYVLDGARYNKFKLPVKAYTAKYDADKEQVSIVDPNGEVLEVIKSVVDPSIVWKLPQYFDFLTKQMSKECTFAICYWDGHNANIMQSIDRLKAQGKYVYIYTAQI